MAAKVFEVANGIKITGDTECTGDVDLASNKSYKINNSLIANSSQLGTTIRTEVLNKAESDALALAIALG